MNTDSGDESTRKKGAIFEVSQSYPKVNTDSGDKATRKKGAIFEANENACLSHAAVSNQHHLEHRHVTDIRYAETCI